MRIAIVCVLMMIGCGEPAGEVDAGAVEDAGAPPDTGAPIDAGADAGPSDAGGEVGPAHCLHEDLVLAEIVPGVSVTVFNPTSDTIAIDDFNHALCRRPSYIALKEIEAGVSIAPGASHAFVWPSGPPGSFADDDETAGEIALYNFSRFDSATALIDFVCWGPGIAVGRRDVAEQDGDWAGACAGAITGGALRRLPETDGHGAASYDPSGAAATLSCP